MRFIRLLTTRQPLEVRAVFLDISKAFVKVWYDGLIFKMRQNGISGNLLKLFQYYLTNRKQRVVLLMVSHLITLASILVSLKAQSLVP